MLVPTTCTLTKPTVRSDRFAFRGNDLDDQGRTNFSQVYNPDLEKVYRTFYGPYVSHKGVVYADNDEDFNLAIPRLTATTFETLQMERQAIINQQNFFSNSVTLGIITKIIQERFFLLVDEYCDIDRFVEYIHAPHPKRKARIAAYQNLVDDGRLSHRTFVEIVKGKMKLEEWAKPGKNPRLINDYTVVGSLLGGFVAELMKKAIAQTTIDVPCGRSLFVASPDTESLQLAFELLDRPPLDVIMVYFSDDSCVSMKTDEGWAKFNLDISAADRSAHQAVFDKLVECSRSHPVFCYWIQRAVEQCKLPLRIKRGVRKVILKPREATLYSGSVLTTLINNLANLSIFACLVQTRSVGAVQGIGYKVTSQPVTVLEDFQFLKHSCTLIDDVYVPWLNIGVMMRCLGSCKFDLPGRGSIARRGFLFNCALVQSMCHAGDTPILRMLQRKFDALSDMDISSHLPYVLANAKTKRLPPVGVDAICRRYKCQDFQVEEFIQLFTEATDGQCVKCRFSDAVLDLDYGL